MPAWHDLDHDITMVWNSAQDTIEAYTYSIILYQITDYDVIAYMTLFYLTLLSFIRINTPQKINVNNKNAKKIEYDRN